MTEILLIHSKQPNKTQTINVFPEKMFNGECLIGRDERCCVVLNDPFVSRIHGKIVYENGNYYYVDLGSRNSSNLNNQAIKVNQNYCLKPSDSIEISPYILWIKSLQTSNLNLTITATSLSPHQYMPLAVIDPEEISRWSEGELTVRCQQIIDETHDVKTFSLIADPPRLFTYKPGQFVTLYLSINGKKVRRSYSLSSSPSRPHTLEITVKRVPPSSDTPGLPPGLVSNWLHDHMEVGSQLKLKGPMGDFTCFENPAPKLLLISAGSGITPMMSMSRWLCDTLSQVDIVFIHSARTPDDIIFRQELELMAAKYPNFKLAITTTRSAPGKVWFGHTGKFNDSMLTAIAPDFCQRNVYVCGPHSFMTAVKSIFEELKFPMNNYFQESFGLPKSKTKTTQLQDETPKLPAQENAIINSNVPVSFRLLELLNQFPSQPDFAQPVITNQIDKGIHSVENKQTFTTGFGIDTKHSDTSSQHQPIAQAKTSTVTYDVLSQSAENAVVLVQSGQELVCDGEEPILDVAQEQGIDLPYGCGMGVCGKCKIRKLSGEVAYEQEPECDHGHILTCVAKPVGRVVLEA